MSAPRQDRPPCRPEQVWPCLSCGARVDALGEHVCSEALARRTRGLKLPDPPAEGTPEHAAMVAARRAVGEQGRRLRVLAYGWAGAACMFCVGGLARFIEPGDGWAVWAALALILAALVCLLRMSALIRWTDDEGR